ncbi:MAG: sodium:solute symporter [Verrucomicrobiota bacterium JB022]|nr:sodium:solute symporter [Verrucomicrobiota bacterium JB022]
MGSHFTFLDLGVLVVYFAAIMGVGLFFMFRERSVESYTAASRSMSGWLTGLSILGTYVSSISFLALPGKAFAENWNPYVFSLSLFIATPIAVWFFLPYYRRSHYVSAYHHLEDRFGAWARVYASICYLLTQLARMGTVMYLMALPLKELLGWDIYTVIVVTGVAVTAYTFMGGITAVIWTDAIQTVILIVGALACAAVMVFSLPDGPGQVFTLAAEHDKFSLGDYGPGLTTTTFWVTLIYGFFINLNNFGIDQSYVQRYIAAKSDKEARRSIWLGGLMYIPVSAIFFFIGTALFAYYTAFPEALPGDYQGNPDRVFPWFIVSALPPGITGLLIAAIFAAAMSTLSTSLNSAATIVLSDYYQRFFNREANERQSMRFVLITTIVFGAAGTLMALSMTQVKNALDAWWGYASIFSGGMLGLFLLSILARRANATAALVGTIVGLILILWMSLSPKMGWLGEGLQSPFHNYLVIVFGTTTILLVGFLCAQFAFGRRQTPHQP